MPRVKSGVPARLLTRAAAEQTTTAGHSTAVWKRPVSSSTTNTAPISGLLKPPARPAPAPIAIRLWVLSLASKRGKRCRRPWATAAPNCTTGPSRPRGIRARLAADQMQSRATVAKGAIKAAACSGFSRLSIVWGMPEPEPRPQGPA